MPSSRDVGGRDFEDTVTVPGPMIRSRHVDSEDVEGERTEATGLVDEVRCPTCAGRFPGVAVACPADGTDLTGGAAADEGADTDV